MKATGIVRRIDDLGRVVIPKEIRRKLHIKEGDPLEIFTGDGGVTFKKYNYAEDALDAVMQVKIYIEADDLSCKDEILKMIQDMIEILKMEGAENGN